ncbi:unnamed protein product [Allacma fusca]|uniref:Uncharacterized protein n=1 Tax=Allacma fusca TaxID=39272 RepID=A0A8J2PF83_9HEXA|nr:unnamed protein product [Allacma fusca]
MTRIVVVTCGRPCGPCCGRRRFMLLRKASMLIAVFEFFTGSAILAGSLGSLAATGLNRQELVPDNYSQAEYEQLCLSHAWHAVCSIILIAFSIVLVFGYLNVSKYYF